MTSQETALIEAARARALALLQHPEAIEGPMEDFLHDLALDVLTLSTALKQARDDLVSEERLRHQIQLRLDRALLSLRANGHKGNG